MSIEIGDIVTPNPQSWVDRQCYIGQEYKVDESIDSQTQPGEKIIVVRVDGQRVAGYTYRWILVKKKDELMTVENPNTCDLQVGDIVRAISDRGNQTAVVGNEYEVIQVGPNTDFGGNGILIRVRGINVYGNTAELGQFRSRWQLVRRAASPTQQPGYSEATEGSDDSLNNLRAAPCKHGGFIVVNSESKVVVAAFTALPEAMKFIVDNKRS